MAHLITADAKFKVAAVANLATSGGWTPVEVNATGFDRACFVVQRGSQTGASKNALRTSLYHAGTTAVTYALASGTLGTMANTTSNKAYQLEFSVNATKPFLKLYGTGGGTGHLQWPVLLWLFCIGEVVRFLRPRMSPLSWPNLQR